MIEQVEINQITELVEKVLNTMTLAGFTVKAGVGVPEALEVDIELAEPQFLIGQHGQALQELQHIVRLLVNKKLKKPLHVKLDINGYKKKKIDHVRRLAVNVADEAAVTREEKILPPMSSYERMVVHSTLADRSDVVTESRGEGLQRFVVIKPA